MFGRSFLLCSSFLCSVLGRSGMRFGGIGRSVYDNHSWPVSLALFVRSHSLPLCIPFYALLDPVTCVRPSCAPSQCLSWAWASCDICCSFHVVRIALGWSSVGRGTMGRSGLCSSFVRPFVPCSFAVLCARP
ncbi:hypothetical protein DFP72DRAFT_635851 [Ephemerocybe angulata]|uniref:Secreted protein n=1 Tax=Ephemerocybe angulata TaxID=980116 RepID=A0A8H6HG45_9AGAR|nr:hypothetical protein DFP72DRAFT_635851 [Tulosesus angulatus]